MRRVFVTGNAGSGKTSSSKRIAEVLQLEAQGLDKVVWQSGWRKTPVDEKRARINDMIADECWVIDGVSHQVFDKADTVFFLDIPLHRCLWNIIVRFIKNGFGTREGLPEDCPEYQGVFKAIKVAFKYMKHTRPAILKRIKLHSLNKVIIHVQDYQTLDQEIRRLT